MAFTRLDARAIARDPGGVSAFACIKNERLHLPHLLAHHRRLGVTRFFIVDDGSTDGSAEFLLGQPDAHVFRAEGRYAETLSGTRWLNSLLDEFASDRWAVIVDADERLTYPGCERVPIDVLTGYLDRLRVRAMRALLLDMYSDRPVVETVYREGEDPLVLCPYFDRDGYYMTDVVVRDRRGEVVRSDKSIMLGGVRERVFWPGRKATETPPYLTKFPLQRWIRGRRLGEGYHTTDLPGAETAAVTGAVLHFKFLSTFLAKANDREARAAQPANASEWERCRAAFEKSPRLSLFHARSTRYRDSEQLVDIGLATAEPGYRRWVRRAAR